MAELRPSAIGQGNGPATAGIVSRGLSAVVDVAVALSLVVAEYVVQATVVFLRDPRGFVPPDTTVTWFVTVGILLSVAYLTLSWAVLAGTRGERMMGLRVVTGDGLPPSPLRSAVRAVLCVVFPLGLLWAAVNARQRSVQDLLLGTRVVHDWR